MEKYKQVKPVKAEIAYKLTYQFYKKVNKESFYC